MASFDSRHLFIYLVFSLAIFSPLSANALDTPRPDRGPMLFKHCVSCHSLRAGQEHRVGPNLFGVLDRGVAALPDFDYSDTLMARAGSQWTQKALNAFIAKPHLATPGSNMKFNGLLNPHDRADLLAWLAIATRDRDLPENIDTPAYVTHGGDPQRGEHLFRPCRACHSHEPGAGHKIGPNLFGVIGREAASAEGFAFSESLERRNVHWNHETLDVFFIEYKDFAQGTHRAFKSLKSPQDRADIIAWLETLKPADRKDDQ